MEGVPSTVRCNNQAITINNPLLRFERYTEAKEKASDNMEKHLNACFEASEIDKLPETVAELKTSPASGWSDDIEKSLLHSMAFSENDMLSCPVILMLAVSSTDVDPVACMAELCSRHYAPACMSNVSILIYCFLSQCFS